MAKIEPVEITAIKSKRERTEIEFKLRRVAQLKAEKKTIEEELTLLAPDLASLMVGADAPKIRLDGIIHSVFNGTNVSISQDRLRASLMSHFTDVKKIKAVMEESVKRTPYTTISSKVEGEGEDEVEHNVTGRGNK